MQFEFPFMVPSYINLILKQAVWLRKESTVLRVRRIDLNPAQSLAIQAQENHSTSLSLGFFIPSEGREKILDEGNLMTRDLEVKVIEDLGLD